MSALPDRTLIAKPFFNGREFLWLEPACPNSTDFLGNNQAGPLEHTDVLHEGRQRHVEWHGEITHRYITFAKPLHDGPARGISECIEGAIKSSLIVSHVANYSIHDS